MHAHIIAATETIQSYGVATSVDELANAIVTNYIILPVSNAKEVQNSVDKVYLYACEALTLGLLWLGFYDAIREGDGDRILQYWRFLIIIFKSTNHPNYAKEAVILLYQYTYIFSERQKAQLLWSRCVNTKGLPGCNMPCDLFMEHLNRPIKNRCRGMGGNITPAAIVKAGKALGVVKQVSSLFEEKTLTTAAVSDKHSYPSLTNDIKKMVAVLNEERVFTPLKKRQHSAFQIKCGVLQKHSRSIMINKVQEAIDKIDRV